MSTEGTVLVKTIAECNRANAAILESLDCHYTYDLVVPTSGVFDVDLSNEATFRKVTKNGRYAFSGDKEYTQEAISGTSGQSLVFIRNGSKGWVRSGVPEGSPGLVGVGTAYRGAVRPGTVSPWQLVDFGLSAKLDRLDPETDGAVCSAREVLTDGAPLIEVVYVRPVPPSHREFGDLQRLTLWYSPDAGYTLSHYTGTVTRARAESGVEKDTLCNSAKITWEELSVGGNKLYFPVRISREEIANGKVYSKEDYRIDGTKLRLNAELPDDLFIMDIHPSDQVVSLDLEGRA